MSDSCPLKNQSILINVERMVFTMNNHYIPRLLLRPFSENGKVNLYHFQTAKFATKKIERVFAEKDLFDPELEQQLAVKLEGMFGDLLNHKLLKGDKIHLDRKENLLLRKFVLLLFLRSPLLNMSWEEMVEKTEMADSYEMKKHLYMMQDPIYRSLFEKYIQGPENYISNLNQALACEALDDIVQNQEEFDSLLWAHASNAQLATCAFWDCSQAEQEFIFPKLQGINLLDMKGSLYKAHVIQKKLCQMYGRLPYVVEQELERLLYGSLAYSLNYTIVPLSPTRALICYSPYFRAFFPMYDPTGKHIYYPPLLTQEQFDLHFYEKTRMELFEPCQNFLNAHYTYQVQQLTAAETWDLNGLLLNMETDTFVFHDFNRIRDSFWYYQYQMVFANKKKHDFRALI